MLSSRIPITAAGAEKLKAELEYLKKTARPAVVQAIAEAREKGDLSENAEYDAAKEAQGLLEMRISQLKDTIANARIIDDSKLNTTEIQLLNTVKITKPTSRPTRFPSRARLRARSSASSRATRCSSWLRRASSPLKSKAFATNNAKRPRRGRGL